MTRAGLFAAVALVATSAPALAHEVGLSTATLWVHGREVTAELAFARGELAAGWATGELSGLQESAATDLARGVAVDSAGAACPPSGSELRPLDRDGLQLVVRFRCAHEPASLSYRLPLLQRLGHGHRHLVTVRSGKQEQRSVLHREQPVFTVSLDAANPGGAFGRLLALGAEHILTGWDHLIFLLGLLLVSGRLLGLVKTVTAFTIGHSLTLACGALGIFSFSPRWVEPLIALSIVYVGFENLYFRWAERRWLIALAFGLLHGFGFSGALSELALPRAELLPALLAFNLGVEAGQLAVLAVVVPLLALARRWAPFRTYVAPALGGAVIVPGVVWFVLRVGAG